MRAITSGETPIVLTGLQLLNPNNSPAFQAVTCSLESGPGLAACVKAAETADKNPGDVIVGPSTKFNGLYASGSVFTRGWYWTGSLNFPLSNNKAHPISELLQGDPKRNKPASLSRNGLVRSFEPRFRAHCKLSTSATGP
jgi:hypothetical protein